MRAEIWHNPRCSKSRATLALLEEAGVEVSVVPYLESPPTAERLNQVLELLDMKPSEFIRRKEEAYKAQGLGPSTSEQDLLQAMIAEPRLIERPVVITDKGAALGRPPENVTSVL